MSNLVQQQTFNPKFIRKTRWRNDSDPADRQAKPAKITSTGRTPRVSKLMALAIRFDHLLHKGLVKSQTELAELSYITKPRVTQIMNLLHLASDIQEDILFLPKITEGKDPITERHLRHIVSEIDWQRQSKLWAKWQNEKFLG
jgi:hypothetical protein